MLVYRPWMLLLVALACLAVRSSGLEKEDDSEEVESPAAEDRDFEGRNSEGRGSREGRFFNLNGFFRPQIHGRIRPHVGHVPLVSTLVSPERDEALPSGGSEADPEAGAAGGAVWDDDGSATAVFVNRPWVHDGLGNFFGLGFPSFQPWYKGPNVCKLSKEVNDDAEGNGSLAFAFNFQSKQCQETEDAFICTTKIRTMNESKTTTETFVCCHGFVRRKDGAAGCMQVDLKDLMTTMKDIGASKFVDLIEENKLDEEFKKENVTIFSPTNIALKDIEQTNEVTSSQDEEQGKMVKGHVVKGMLRTSDFRDEMVLETLDGRSSIRINEFYNPAKLMTANCVPIVSTNNLATNGVVHVVDEALPSPNMTLLEMIKTDPQFSILRTLLPSADLETMLSDASGHHTVLAPNDDAFSKVGSETLKKWQNGEACVGKLLRGHVLSHVICSMAVPSSARVRNLNNEPVTLERDGDKLLADGSAVVARDLMATNGALHVIDQLMMSQESKSLVQTLMDSQMTDLVHLIESANLTSAFAGLDNFTFFAPSPDALKEVSLKEWEDMKSSGGLAQMLNFHMVPSKLAPRNFFNNMLLQTAEGDDKIRMNVFPRAFSFERPTVTAQCARVVSANNPVCGGTVYLIDKVLRPAGGDVLEVMESAGNFATFLNLVKESGMADQLRSNAGPFTVLAPTDQAFQRISKKMLAVLRGEDAESFVKQHILPEMACTSGIGHNGFLNRLEYRSLDGNTVPTQRSLRGNVYFGGARVSKGDLMARNGVVHAVERVLGAQPESQDRLGFGFNFDFNPFFRSF